MRKHTHRIARGTLAVGAAAAAVLAMTATPAHAATSYTPTLPGGGSAVTFVGSSVSFTAQPSGQTLTCTQFDLDGTITNPGTSRAYGAEAGTFTGLTASGCTNPIAGATTVTPKGNWSVSITGDATGTEWPAELTGVKAYVKAANCEFYAGGAADTADDSQGSGVVTGTYDDSSGVFTPDTSQPGLVISTPPVGSICPLLDIYEDDTVDVGGTWTSTPVVDISNP